MDYPSLEPGPSRATTASRAASVAVQPSSATPSPAGQSSRKRASHAVASPVQNGEELATTVSPARDVYSHPAAVAYAQAHPRRTIPKFGPYLLLQTLGEGEFGKVKLGLHSQWGEEVAVKLIRRGNIDSQQRMTKVEREIEVLRALKHTNIVRLYDVIETDKYIGIILEYASGGELFDHILAHRYLKEKDASKLFAQLISGVWYIHQKKIVHRDLKLENLLLDRHRNVIITDFGFANRFEDRGDDLMQTSCGSPCYAAPELVISDGSYVGTAVDIWSCGVILYAMLAGYLPFDDDPANPEGDNINLLYRYIVNTPLAFPDYVSDEARDLLKLMLVPEPRDRGTLEQIMDHSWLSAWRHLFDKEVDDLERAAMEIHQMKRLAYQRQMKQAAQARVVDATKMTRSQSARTDAPAGAPPSAAAAAAASAAAVSSRSRSHHTPDPNLSPSQTQPEFFYETSAEPYTSTPAAAPGKRAHNSVAVAQSPPRLPLDDDPFAPPAGLFVPTTPADEPGKENKKVAGSPPSAAAPEGKSKSKNGFRHTIQVEYGDANEDEPKKAATGSGSPERERRHERAARKASLDATAKALPAVPPPERAPSTQRVRADRGPPPSAMPVSTPLSPPAVHVAPASPPATPGRGGPDVAVAHVPTPEKAPNGSQASRHRRELSVGKISLGKIFGGAGSDERAPAAAPVNGSHTSSRVPSDSSAVRATEDEEEEQRAWYVSRKGSKDTQTKGTWYMGKKQSTSSTQVASPPPSATVEGDAPLLSPSQASAAGKKSRRNTLTVMVEPFSRSLKARGKRATGATDALATPTAEKSYHNQQHGNSGLLTPTTAVGQGKDNAGASKEELGPPSAGFSPPPNGAGLGMPASSTKARKVMQWFRTKSKGGEEGASAVDPESSTIPTPPQAFSHGDGAVIGATPERAAPAVFITTPASADPKRERRPSRPSRPAVFGGSGGGQRAVSTAVDGATPSPSGTFRERVRRSIGVGASPAKAAVAPAGVLRIHHGAVDYNTITTGNPPDVMAHVRGVLQGMGVDIQIESEFKFRCIRAKRRKSQAAREAGVGPGVAAFTMMGSAGSNGVDKRGLPIPSAGSFSGGGMLRGLLMRRQSSQVSAMGTPEPSSAERTSPPSATTELAAEPGSPNDNAVYGDRTQDLGDEIRFSVELTRLDRLKDTYSLDIRRLKGNLRSYKFVYDTLRERADLQSQQ